MRTLYASRYAGDDCFGSHDASVLRKATNEMRRRWHNFQVFANWYTDNYPRNLASGEYQLDKDIRIEGNKEYGPDACKFVSRSENMAARVFG